MGRAKNISILFVRGSDIWREAVNVDKLRVQLEACAAGEIDMTSTQLKAAELLLQRTIPTLTSVEHSGEVGHRTVREQTDAELLDFVARNGSRDQAERIRAAHERQNRIALVHGVHDAEVEAGEDPPSYQ